MRDVPIGSNALAAVAPINFAARRREIVSCIVGRLVRPPVSPRRTGQRSVIFPLFDLRDKRVKRLRTGDAPAHRINLHIFITQCLQCSRDKDVKVDTMRGCIAGSESFHTLVSEIEQGKYDTSLSRPAW